MSFLRTCLRLVLLLLATVPTFGQGIMPPKIHALITVVIPVQPQPVFAHWCLPQPPTIIYNFATPAGNDYVAGGGYKLPAKQFIIDRLTQTSSNVTVRVVQSVLDQPIYFTVGGWGCNSPAIQGIGYQWGTFQLMRSQYLLGQYAPIGTPVNTCCVFGFCLVDTNPVSVTFYKVVESPYIPVNTNWQQQGELFE
jgi:hypothetical protein